MRLSVIIPVYNVAEYLSQCLDSVFTQDLTNCEVICVNDGSTDDSRAILAKYQKKFPELIIVDRDNGGLSAARNSGLKVAKGEYIYFLDSDDYLYSGVLFKMLSFAIERKLEVACFNVLKNGENGYFNLEYQNEVVLTGTSFCKRFFDTFSFYYPAPVWMYLYNRLFLTNNNLIFKEGILHEDEEFTPRVMYYAQNVALLNIPIQYHRIGREGAITATTTIRHLSDSTTICRSLYLFFNQQHKVDSIFYHNIYFFYLVTILKGYKNNILEISYLNEIDFTIFKASAQNAFERRCARLAGVNIKLMCKYYENKLPKPIMKIINHFL